VSSADRTPQLHVVGDGAVASVGIAGGRLVPVVMVDTRLHPILAEAIAQHRHVDEGDFTFTWGVDSRRGQRVGHVGLRLSFIRPVTCEAQILFALPARAALVNQILMGYGLYLQHGEPGDRMANTMERPRILVGMPHTDFAAQWTERMLPSLLRRQSRERGLSRAQARVAAADMQRQLTGLGEAQFPAQ
jgi:hypothetical protein